MDPERACGDTSWWLDGTRQPVEILADLCTGGSSHISDTLLRRSLVRNGCQGRLATMPGLPRHLGSKTGAAATALPNGHK